MPLVHTFRFSGSLGLSRVLLLPINHKNKIKNNQIRNMSVVFFYRGFFFKFSDGYFFCTPYRLYSILMTSRSMIEESSVSMLLKFLLRPLFFHMALIKKYIYMTCEMRKGPIYFNLTILRKQR